MRRAFNIFHFPVQLTFLAKNIRFKTENLMFSEKNYDEKYKESLIYRHFQSFFPEDYSFSISSEG